MIASSILMVYDRVGNCVGKEKRVGKSRFWGDHTGFEVWTKGVHEQSRGEDERLWGDSSMVARGFAYGREVARV